MRAAFSTQLRRIGLAPQSNVIAEIKLLNNGLLLPESTVVVGESILNALQQMPHRALGASEYGDVDGMVHEIGEVSAEGVLWSIKVELVWGQVVVGGE